MSDKPEAIPRTEFLPLIQCGLLSIYVNFECHSAILSLPKRHCTDMKGAIELCKAIDDDIKFIRTIAQGRRDTCYVRQFGNQWMAFTDTNDNTFIA